MEFSFDFAGLCAKFERSRGEIDAFQEDVASRLRGISSSDGDCAALRRQCAAQCDRIARLELDAVDAQHAVVDARSDAAELRGELFGVRLRLAASEARVDTLLGFVPDRDVTMVFQGGNVHTCRDAADVAAGALSPRHASHRIVVSRFTKQGTPAPRERLSEMDVRRCDAKKSPSARRGPAPAAQTAASSERRGNAAPSGGAAACLAAEVVDELRRTVDDAGLLDACRAECAAGRAAAALDRAALVRVLNADRGEAGERLEAMRAALETRDDQLRELTDAVVVARRDALGDRTALAAAEAHLAAAHATLRDRAAALRARYEAEAYAARQAISFEISAATAKLTAQLEDARAIATHATGIAEVQKATHAARQAKARRVAAVRRHASVQFESRRCGEIEGLGRDVAELRRQLGRPPKRATSAPNAKPSRDLCGIDSNVANMLRS